VAPAFVYGVNKPGMLNRNIVKSTQAQTVASNPGNGGSKQIASTGICKTGVIVLREQECEVNEVEVSNFGFCSL